MGMFDPERVWPALAKHEEATLTAWAYAIANGWDLRRRIMNPTLTYPMYPWERAVMMILARRMAELYDGPEDPFDMSAWLDGVDFGRWTAFAQPH